MTDALDSAVPAGWYPDPWGASAQRWWDGSKWAESIRTAADQDAGGADQDPVQPEFQPTVTRSTFEPPAAHEAFPSRRTLRGLTAQAEPESANAASTMLAPAAEAVSAPAFTSQSFSALPPTVFSDPEPVASARPVVSAAPAMPSKASHFGPGSADDDWAASLSRWDDVEPTMAPLDALPIFGDAPPISYSQRPTRYKPIHGRTSPVWLIVFMPTFHAAAAVGSLFLFPGIIDLANPTVWAPNLLALRDWALFATMPLAIAFLVFTLVMGFQDRARLRLLGHDQTASPWWILLHPLVYLIVRSVRVNECTGRRGSGPLTAYLCLYFAPAIAIGVASAVVSALDGAIPT